MNTNHFRIYIIRPALEAVALHSQWAENLLLGTALQESRLEFLHQLNGPALGFYQMEPATHDDLWNNWIKYRPDMEDKARGFISATPAMSVPGVFEHPQPSQMIWNLRYATVMCRLHYYRASFNIPNADKPAELGAVWKRVYNTYKGAGTVDQFVQNYRRAHSWGVLGE